MMDVVEIIRARFHEAAETERHLPRPKLPNGNGFWPLYRYTAEDREGWDDAARADSADEWARHRKLTRDAISRHDECLVWTIMLLPNEHHRHVVWKWAFCQANNRSFGAACKRKGWVRMTAYRRLNASFERIAEHLLGNGMLPRPPDEKYLLQNTPDHIHKCTTIDNSVAERPRFRPAWRNEDSRDLLTTSEGVADFSKHLNSVNADRRRLQEREAKRRARIGAMAS